MQRTRRIYSRLSWHDKHLTHQLLFVNLKTKGRAPDPRPADILIWAGSVTDRYLSSRWKLFLDRNFVFGYIPIYRGKQIGVIISGPLSQVPTLREPLEQGQDWHRSNLINFISDECADSNTIDALLLQLAENSVRFSESGYVKTPTFAYVGVSKLIRDELWRYQRAIMIADYKYYLSHKTGTSEPSEQRNGHSHG